MCTFAAQRFDLHVLTRIKNTMQIFIQFRRPIVIVKTTACKLLYFPADSRKICLPRSMLPCCGKRSNIFLRYNRAVTPLMDQIMNDRAEVGKDGICTKTHCLGNGNAEALRPARYTHNLRLCIESIQLFTVSHPRIESYVPLSMDHYERFHLHIF